MTRQRLLGTRSLKGGVMLRLYGLVSIFLIFLLIFSGRLWMHQGQDEADEGSANPYVGRSGTSDRGKRDSGRRPDGLEARQGLGLGVKDNPVGQRVRCCAHMIKDHALLRTDQGLGYIRSGVS